MTGIDDRGLTIWVVFDHPADFPGHFVARRQIVRSGQIEITGDALFAQTLIQLRNKLPPGLVRQSRHPMDEAQIIEFWF